MKRVFNIALLLVVGVVVNAAPVKSDEAAKGVVFTNDGSAPTAADYVQDGLVFLWDGIENVGWEEHSDTITSWTDLVSGQTIPNVIVVDGAAIDFIKNSEIRNPVVRQVMSLPGQTLEIASFAQSNPNTFQWLGRSRNGGTEWLSTMAIRPSRVFSRQESYEMTGQNLASTRAIVSDEDIVSFYLGGELQKIMTQPSSWIDEGRVLFYSGVSLCCIRVYNRPLSAHEIQYNALIDKMRFGL